MPLDPDCDENRTPPNCVFEVDDFEAEWLYHAPFDFIHARELEGCISDDERFFQQALQHLTPGGCIEMQAVAAPFLSDDGTAEKAVNAQLWLKTLCEGSAQFGKPIDCATSWKAKLIAAGFVDVQEEVRKVRYSNPFCRILGQNTFLSHLNRCPLARGLKTPSSKRLASFKPSKKKRPLNHIHHKSFRASWDGHRRKYRSSWPRSRMRSGIPPSISIFPFIFFGVESLKREANRHLDVNARMSSDSMHQVWSYIQGFILLLSRQVLLRS